MAINEEVYKNLGLKGFLGALPERIYKHLGSLGHVGTISDRLFKEGGYLSYITNLLGVVSRYFVTLDPVLNSHYEMAAPITFAGDFEAEVEFSTTSFAVHIIVSTSEITQDYIFVRSTGEVGLRVSDGAITGTIVVADGKLHTIKVTKVGTTVSLFVDGILDGTATTTTTPTEIGLIGGWSANSLYYSGIIANAKFTDQSGASDVVTTFKLDQATANTESSVEGNNSVTYNNIPQSARDLYTLDGNIWTDSAGNTIEVAS